MANFVASRLKWLQMLGLYHFSLDFSKKHGKSLGHRNSEKNQDKNGRVPTFFYFKVFRWTRLVLPATVIELKTIQIINQFWSLHSQTPDLRSHYLFCTIKDERKWRLPEAFIFKNSTSTLQLKGPISVRWPHYRDQIQFKIDPLTQQLQHPESTQTL